jgi:acetylglutamate kinase
VTLLVVKVGGAVAASVAAHIAALEADGYSLVVVHGAGPQISQQMSDAGIAVEFVDGRRVTTAEGIKVVAAALATVNAAICAALGPRARGLHGDEIGLAATAVPALGLVGDPLACAPPAIVEVLDQGLIPVVTPLAAGPLNVNADQAAAALAIGLGAERLLFFTDVEGLLLDGAVVARITPDESDALLAGGTLEGGIIPKLGAAVTAARGGVLAMIGRTVVAS